MPAAPDGGGGDATTSSGGGEDGREDADPDDAVNAGPAPSRSAAVEEAVSVSVSVIPLPAAPGHSVAGQGGSLLSTYLILITHPGG